MDLNLDRPDSSHAPRVTEPKRFPKCSRPLENLIEQGLYVVWNTSNYWPVPPQSAKDTMIVIRFLNQAFHGFVSVVFFKTLVLLQKNQSTKKYGRVPQNCMDICNSSMTYGRRRLGFGHLVHVEKNTTSTKCCEFNHLFVLLG